MFRFILFALLIAFLVSLLIMAIMPWLKYMLRKYKKQVNTIDKALEQKETDVEDFDEEFDK